MSEYYLFESWTAIQALVVVGLLIITAISVWMVVRDLVLHKDKMPHRAFYQWAKCYGPVCSVRTGLSSAVVVLNSAKSCRQAMTEHHSSITAKSLTTALQVLSLDKTMVALSDYGRGHRLMKKLMVSHLLGTTPQVIGRTVEPLKVEELGSEVVSVQDMYNLIIRDAATAALEINWRDFVPLINRWLPNRKLENMLNDVTRRSAIVRALIRQERELLSSGKEPKGYIDMLLKEGVMLSEKQLEIAIWEPVIESTITSHVAMVWAFFNLAKHPHT